MEKYCQVPEQGIEALAETTDPKNAEASRGWRWTLLTLLLAAASDQVLLLSTV